ncbi:sulfotransferase family 2 domain-containing protein [Celeribacter halophilus]|uniref:Sulfotransferase family protein n=1 Tax=Celeribacter halophilus TaxID=576117 RepID=A0A1I3WJP9_9RHOB|nr:sulfotransferase family 2 domain-containing protein [Celeribacter halophilus]PZX09855.1 sulfotransferase family protein [Celeribacter halophilus]SFK06701.1 Sulfotransferase family protein [Celeribacter halophilus]
MISHRHKCIFIHIPKCAGTSIEAVLGHHENTHEQKERQDHRSIRMLENPIPPSAFLSAENLREVVRRYRWQSRDTRPENKLTVTAEQFQSYYKFTIVRNPWARVHSWYQNVIRDEKHLKAYGISSDMPFDTFLKRHAGNGMLKPQTYWLKGFDGTIKMDYVGRFEELSKAYADVSPYLQGPVPTSLPHEIRGGHSESWRDAFTKETRDLIAQVYAEEIELFGYSFT